MTNQANLNSKVPTIEVSHDPALAAGTYISDILAVNLGRPILMLLAGGSARKVLDYINPEYLSPDITVTVTDERFTDNLDHNNFDLLQTTHFYNELTQQDAYCINTSLFAGDDIDLHAARFEKNIQDWMREFPKGLIIGLFGIGADGHTAGIIPGVYDAKAFEERFDNKDHIVATVIDKREGSQMQNKNEFPERITVTLPFMRQIDFPLFYVEGEGKRSALEKSLNAESALSDVPARIMLEMKSPVVFTNLEQS